MTDNSKSREWKSTFRSVRSDRIEFSQSWQCWRFCIALILIIRLLISDLNFNSMNHNKCKFAIKFIPLLTISIRDLTKLEVTQVTHKFGEKW